MEIVTRASFTGAFEDFTTEIMQKDILDPKNITGAMKTQLKLYDIFIPLLGVLIIVINFAVVISSGLILKKGQQPRSTYLLLGNIAMADLVTGIAVVLGQAYPAANRTHYSCSVMIGMIVSSTVTSIYSVALIAMDRFLYIIHGLKYQKWVYPTRVRLMIGMTWIFGLIIGFLPLMGWSGNTNNGKICWFIILAPPELIILTTILGFIPLLIICVLYSIILYYAIQKTIEIRKAGRIPESNLRMFKGAPSKLEHDTNNDVQVANEEIERQGSGIAKLYNRLKYKNSILKSKVQTNHPTKWKAIKVVLYTTGSLIITWVPYFLACSLYVFCDYENNPKRCHSLKFAIASPLAILGFLNSLLNPIIYAWWHNGFRKSLNKICCRRKETLNVGTTQKSSSSQNQSSQIYTISKAENSQVNQTSQENNSEIHTQKVEIDCEK